MDPLATLDDLDARSSAPLGPETATQAEALLGDASALVRSYTGQDFSPVNGDAVVLRPIGSTLRLPRRPVRAVSSVAAIIATGDLVLPGWRWDGADLIDLSLVTSRVFVALPSIWDEVTATSYRVTYDHGGPVPDDVRSVVVAMVLRVLSSPSPVQGLVSERIGAYNYQLQQASGAPGLSVRLSPDDKAALVRYRRTADTIPLSR